MRGWFIWREGETSGPFSSEELAAMVVRDQIGAQSWLWHEQLGEWVRAGSFDFLKRRLQTGRGDVEVRRLAEPVAGKVALPRATAPTAQATGDISLTNLYLARLKREPLVKLAIEARGIEAAVRAGPAEVAGAEAWPRVDVEADVEAFDGAREFETWFEAQHDDPLAERLASGLVMEPSSAAAEAGALVGSITRPEAPAGAGMAPAPPPRQGHAGHMRDRIADALVLALERLGAFRLVDLANTHRLEQAAHVTYDWLSGPMRLGAQRTVGREAFERRLILMLVDLYDRFATEPGNTDVRALIRSQIHSPWADAHFAGMTAPVAAGLKGLVGRDGAVAAGARRAQTIPPPLPGPLRAAE